MLHEFETEDVADAPTASGDDDFHGDTLPSLMESARQCIIELRPHAVLLY
jgi:hypothetical protein